MSNIKIDFSKIKQELSGENFEEEKTPKKRHDITEKPGSASKGFFSCLMVFLIIISLIFGIKYIFGSDSETTSSQPSIWTQIKHLITSSDKPLQGESDNRINILLLGIGGEGHDGPFLTDTIILLSVEPKEKKVAMLSIPRDMAVPIPGYGWRKVNNADAYGEVQNPGRGGELTAQVLSSTLGISIPYYLRVDFSGFENFINKVGGLKICVDNSFTDANYPTDDYKTTAISFTSGCQMMDGKTALEYSRSRHGNNGEGSDFDRSKRQHKILLALKDKLLSFQILSNPLNIKSVYDEYNKHVSTNMEMWEMLRLEQMAKGISSNNLITFGLDDSNYLKSFIGEDGAYLLQPPGGNFDQIRELVANIFGQTKQTATNKSAANTNAALVVNENKTPEPEKIVEKKPAPVVTPSENAKIEIRNGTFIVGLASRVKTYLENSGYTIATVGNTPFRNYKANVIYDQTGGKFPATIEYLSKNLNATVIDDIPGWVKNISTNDIVLILGEAAGEMNLQ